MNSFEQYTIIIGVLAILFEGISYLRTLVHKLLHKEA
jgi:hypothetical protein